jgi:uncharacterized protein YkwD
MTGTAGVSPRSVRLRTAFACLLALAVFASAFAGTVAAPRPSSEPIAPAAISAWQYCPDGEELAFLTLVNRYRRQHRLAPVYLSRTLGAAAKHHSQEMAAYSYFSHTLAGGVTWSQNLSNHGYTFNTYRGENLAAGNSGAQATFNQWVNSPPHRANMLNGNYRAIGIGRAYNARSTYRWYWTTTFGGYHDLRPRC